MSGENGNRKGVVKTANPREIPGKCNSPLRGKPGKLCKQTAGSRTPHPGEGRCWLHGGLTPTTHGLYSYRRYAKVKHPRLRELMEEMEEDPDPLDMIEDVKVVRALFVDFIENYDRWRDAILLWHAVVAHRFSDNPDLAAAAQFLYEAAPRMGDFLRAYDEKVEEALDLVLHHAAPRKIMDISAAHRIVGEATSIVAKIEKIRAENAISRADLFRILREMGATVRRHNDEPDPKRRLKLIEVDWGRMLL